MPETLHESMLPIGILIGEGALEREQALTAYFTLRVRWSPAIAGDRITPAVHAEVTHVAIEQMRVTETHWADASRTTLGPEQAVGDPLLIALCRRWGEAMLTGEAIAPAFWRTVKNGLLITEDAA